MVALSLVLSLTQAIRAQENASSSQSQAKPASTYPNTTEGLQLLLQDLLIAAKNGDKEKLAAFLKDMEIPDCDVWLHKMYESDQADSWMGLCNAKTLEQNEKSMQEMLLQFGHEDGRILTRKMNDNPEPGKGLEWGWLHAIKAPLDIYFASWKKADEPTDARGEPFGYFMFIDGGFRWRSGILFSNQTRFPNQIRNVKYVPPKLIKRVDPTYRPDAHARRIGGTVRVWCVLGADGVVYEPQAISGDGFSNDPSLMKAAEDAVIQWRYQPATGDGKPVQINGFKIDITFSPR
jgi:TonB family protein